MTITRQIPEPDDHMRAEIWNAILRHRGNHQGLREDVVCIGEHYGYTDEELVALGLLKEKTPQQVRRQFRHEHPTAIYPTR